MFLINVVLLISTFSLFKMSDYQKFPVHKSIVITNFLQYPSPRLIAGDIHRIADLECVIAVDKRDDSSVETLIHLNESNKIKRVRARYSVGMFNETAEELKSWEGEKEANTDEFLFLKPWTVPQPDKSFTFKFGFHVSAVLGIDNIWMFNFYDALFNVENDSKMIVFKEKNNQKVRLYTHKKLMMFHSSKLSIYRNNLHNENGFIIPACVSMNMLEKCLQIAHGVQVHCSVEDLKKINQIAKLLGLKNVIKYYERQRIENLNQVKVTDQVFHSMFMRDRRHLLVRNVLMS
ncbi:hypothetical protein CRE_28961 [Caenorhabditis remanei]|uniref:BTB domain-containing protein n=1 Tax=Caenorhabditis remanei TaxID=31234 RepID=E3N5F5_CAERE|nr:hypothetical protein CRE_28961 [Caenorhabditis remanei]